jgi:hypothetical protein
MASREAWITVQTKKWNYSLTVVVGVEWRSDHVDHEAPWKFGCICADIAIWRTLFHPNIQPSSVLRYRMYRSSATPCISPSQVGSISNRASRDHSVPLPKSEFKFLHQMSDSTVKSAFSNMIFEDALDTGLSKCCKSAISMCNKLYPTKSTNIWIIGIHAKPLSARNMMPFSSFLINKSRCTDSIFKEYCMSGRECEELKHLAP